LSIRKTEESGAVEYADGLRYHLEQEWYEYKYPLRHDGTRLTTLFQTCIGKQPAVRGCDSSLLDGNTRKRQIGVRRKFD
jgi:hypothetical protein